MTTSALPKDAKSRKATPIYSGVVKYFPDALAAIAACSYIANEQHNPGTPVHWDRSKSTDELDALMRHLMDAGKIDSDGVRHSTKVAWRALANLQKELEAASPKSDAEHLSEFFLGPQGQQIIPVDPRHDISPADPRHYISQWPAK